MSYATNFRNLLRSRRVSLQSSLKHFSANPTKHTDSVDFSKSFGNEEVASGEVKKTKVSDVFASVASSYDIMNDVMSLGIHRCWKDNFVSSVLPSIGKKDHPSGSTFNIIDVAGGTGDIAIRLARRARNAEVTVLDINPAMLEHGDTKVKASGLTKRIKLVEGDAEKLPFPDNSFNLYTIAFGIRNCSNLPGVLSEAKRVLKPGGLFACLEFSKPIVGAPLYDWYSNTFIPPMGYLIAKDWHSYQYLVESIRKFPTQIPFQNMIEDAGFSNTSHTNLSLGIVAIHTGYKM